MVCPKFVPGPEIVIRARFLNLGSHSLTMYIIINVSESNYSIKPRFQQDFTLYVGRCIHHTYLLHSIIKVPKLITHTNCIPCIKYFYTYFILSNTLFEGMNRDKILHTI